MAEDGAARYARGWMIRTRAGLWLALSSFLLGCGARTGLHSDSEYQASAGRAGGSGSGSGGAGGSGGGISGSGGGSSGSGGATIRTNCQLTGDDPRVAGIKPDEVASLDGAAFVVGSVQSYHWTLQMEDCDGVVPDAQFKIEGVDSRVLKFQPSRPAFYHFTLEATGVAGDRASCKLEVPVMGIGMRVELCWDTSTTTDLDLYLHNPATREPWFARGSTSVKTGLDGTTCNTSNGAAILRGLPRVDWGFRDSPLSECNTPSFEDFLAIGRCPNPRAADDNNQSIAIGTTERMQIDNAAIGQRFRVMVQNFSNLPARPHVFVYCFGQRIAAFDAPPAPANFVANQPRTYGLMWRVADITMTADADRKMSCSAVPVTDRALTIDDATF